MKTDTYQEITEQIIKRLEDVRHPWRRPWNNHGVKQKCEIPENNNESIKRCTQIVENFSGKPAINENNFACYYPNSDYVDIPEIEAFNTAESYYHTLFHELIHSTGHKERLNRKTLVEVEHYKGEEELTAEIGAIFLCEIAGIKENVFNNTMAYIQKWFQTLENDPKMVILAAGAAQKAADYVQK